MASSEILKLTDAVPEDASFVVFKTNPVNSSKGLSVKFDFFAYGGRGGDGAGNGTGGDGIGFFLIDGAQSPQKPGGFGGSLGYAPRDGGAAGLVGGYLGIGFDAFGNFSAGTEGRTGGPGRTSNSVAVRGSQAANYSYLTGTTTLPASLSNTAAGASRADSKRSAQIDLTPEGVLTVQVDLNGDGDFADAGELAVDKFNVIQANAAQGALPSTIKFGFAASTGGATNIHEITNFQVSTFTDQQPIAGSFIQDLQLVGGDTSTGGKDSLTGGAGNDTIIGGKGADTVTGGVGADRFVFSGTNKARALRSSTLGNRDVIADFNQKQGDRFQLNFDDNLATSERPRGLFKLGTVRAKSLTQALKVAYSDKLAKKKGIQALRADEAIIFKFGQRTYLSVNDGRAPFSSSSDLVADITKIQFKAGDAAKIGTLGVSNYFV